MRAALDALGYEGNLVERVRRAMWHEDGDGLRSLDEVAQSLAVSARTLRRMLAEQRLSFSTLLDRERREKAIFLLESSRTPLEAIAERLGYSTLSNFGRAFHHWTEPPQELTGGCMAAPGFHPRRSCPWPWRQSTRCVLRADVRIDSERRYSSKIAGPHSIKLRRERQSRATD